MMIEITEEALARLKRARKDAELTIRYASEALNMKFTELMMREQGMLPFTDEQLTKMCKLYGVSKTWVLTGEGSR